MEPHFPPFFVRETSIIEPRPLAFPSFYEDEADLSFALDLLNPSPRQFDLFDTVTDLVQIERTPSFSSYKRVYRRVEPELSIQTLFDRVSSLESKFDRLLTSKVDGGERKYTWTAEIKNGSVDRKYKWTTEVKEGKKKIDKKYKWTAKIEREGKEGGISRKYTFEASSGDAGDSSKAEKKEGKKKHHFKIKSDNDTRVVEIEEPADHKAVVLRQVCEIAFLFSF